MPAQTSGRAGAAPEPLYDAHKRFVLQSRVMHADETPVAMLDPDRGKTKRACIWAYARGAFDPLPGVVYEFCLGCGAQYPIAFAGKRRRRGTNENTNGLLRQYFRKGTDLCRWVPCPMKRP